MNQLSPSDCLNLYLALKLHFSSPSYDVFKYKWKLKSIPDYTKRKDKYFFEKLSRHSDPENLVLANILFKKDIWVGSLFEKQAEERFRKMIGRWETLPYIFSEDLKKIGKFNESILVKDGQHPRLLKMNLSSQICPETIVILNSLVDFVPYWKKELSDPISKSVILSLDKFTPFVDFDKQQFRKISIDTFNE